MEGVWATGRRHVKISKLYLKALLRRGPNIFVALAWSQVGQCLRLESSLSQNIQLLSVVHIIKYIWDAASYHGIMTLAVAYRYR